MNTEVKKYQKRFNQFRRTMQRITYKEGVKKDPLKSALEIYTDVNIQFVYKYKAGMFLLEIKEGETTKYITPSNTMELITESFIIAEETLFEHFENEEYNG